MNWGHRRTIYDAGSMKRVVILQEDGWTRSRASKLTSEMVVCLVRVSWEVSADI
jgi:hypothetical protein